MRVGVTHTKLKPVMSAWLGLIGSALIIAQASAQVGAQVSAPTTHINTPTAPSMGQSGRATGRGNTALIYNPAAMSASMSWPSTGPT